MSNYDTIAQFFRSKGYSDSAIYGILGNAEDESGGNPNAYSGNPGTGYGIFQWLGGRWNELQNFASSHGGDPLSLQTQLEFAWQEIQTNYRSMLPQSLNGQSAGQAALSWASTFEGAAQSNWNQRAQMAEQFASSGFKIPGGQPNFAVADSGGGGNASLGFSGSGMPNPTAADYTDALGALGGLLNTIPQLKAILQEAVSGGWAVSKFQQAIEQTQWYRTHSDSARQAIALQQSDPATWNQNLQSMERQIVNAGNNLGIDLTDPARIKSIATAAIMQNWSSQDIQQNLANAWSSWFSGTQKWEGQAATFRDQIDQIANNYGVPFTNNGQVGWVQGMLSGKATIEQYKQRAIQQAQSIYRGVANQINETTDLKTIADPYISTMANVLELNPGTLNIQTPQVKQALQGTAIQSAPGNSAVNGGQVQATPLWQFEQQLRDDPRWQFTQGAHDAVSTALMNLGQTFGKV